jgi:hypothetical protein
MLALRSRFGPLNVIDFEFGAQSIPEFDVRKVEEYLGYSDHSCGSTLRVIVSEIIHDRLWQKATSHARWWPNLSSTISSIAPDGIQTIITAYKEPVGRKRDSGENYNLSMRISSF